MKQILHTLWIVLAMLAGLSACSDDKLGQEGEGTILPNGDVVLKVNANIPVPRQIVTRDIDPDGLGVNTLYLFCFDQFGSYIGRREATDLTTTNVEGHYSFTVTVPGSTRIIHFLSNIYLDDISASPGMNETTLIPSLVSASGRMIYWGRKTFADLAALEAFGKGEGENPNVELFRNQAQVRWEIEKGSAAETANLQVFGYALCNRRAWGTVAPFNTSVTSDSERFNFTLDNPFITEPSEEYRALASDLENVTVRSSEPGDPHYMFESPNTLDEPVYAVMKIGTDPDDPAQYKFYKIMFVDGNKNQLPIYRNYQYVIRIKALPDQLGYSSYSEAKNGIAANNAWVSVDPEIPEISDGTHTLNILNGTTQIFNAGGKQFIDFTYNGSDAVSVSWLENDGSLSGKVPVVTNTGNDYRVEMELAQPGEDPVVGRLLIRAGVFSRQIKIYLMKPFEFKPVWVSSGVPMVKGERMSMTFVIPDNYPEELFPITCKIATNKMNANNDLGIQLPIISEACEYDLVNEAGATYKRTTNWGYKFLYTATRPGVQEVFFTLNVSEGNDPTGTVSNCEYAQEGINHTHVFVEADNFQDEEKVVLFQSGSSNRRITITDAPKNNPGFRNINLFPTKNQQVEVTFNLTDNDQLRAPAQGTKMRIATAALVPDFSGDYSAERALYDNDGEPTGTVNGISYYIVNPTAATHTLHFKTKTPHVEDLVRFSIDGDAGNEDSNTWYKSAAVELTADPGSFTFTDFHIVDDDPEIDYVKYGIGQPADIHFSISDDAVKTTDLKVFIHTDNLIPDPTDPNARWLEKTTGGYYFTIPQNFELLTRGTLKFLTNRIASAETVTISTFDDTQALFTSASASFANQPITGTIQLDDKGLLATTSFIVLERKNGTRVGDFNVQSVDGNHVATYKLTVRPEYDFTMDEPLTIYYKSPDNSLVYQAVTTFNDLVAHESGEQVPLIILNRN